VHSQTWKREERWWAARYAGVRHPVRGRNDIPDVENNELALEIKMTTTAGVGSTVLTKAIKQADRAGAEVSKMPVVGVSLPGDPDGTPGRPHRARFVYMHEELFHELWSKYLCSDTM
jgi:hypothetical protein